MDPRELADGGQPVAGPALGDAPAEVGGDTFVGGSAHALLLYIVRIRDSVTQPATVTLSEPRRFEGEALAALGVLAFSLTFPATKLALRGFSPWFIAFGRAVVAAALALGALRMLRSAWPSGSEALRLAVVAGGVVFGFPLLSSLAVERSGSAHAAVLHGLLPAATALVATVRAGERPGRLFWTGCIAGATVVVVFAVGEANGPPTPADAYMLIAVVLCAIGYAEGGVLARTRGGFETICWAVVLSAPVAVAGAALTAPRALPPRAAVAGLGYVGVFSMFLGFAAWYGGLARAGVARASQLQLFQPVLAVAWSTLLLGEDATWAILAAAVGVGGSVAVTQWARVARQ
jgi:drug/metabolite transporter (DMT)-like permease